MSFLARVGLTAFEILNEIYIGVGAGVVGIAVLISHGYKTHQLLRTCSVACISLGSLLYVFQTASDRKKPSKKQIVVITGCDSGLGYSFALHAADLGFTVVAGFLSLESAGALEIRKINEQIKRIELDITKTESVYVALQTITQYIDSNPEYELYGIINNAAVMVFAEFEWQTENLIQKQLNVNLLGTLIFTKAFTPLIRKYRGRIIFITSHCSYACLPGLSVYGATKAAIKGFGDGLRVELQKYGVKVIQITPGSFVTQSNIMAKHSEHVNEMRNEFSPEQSDFYEDYFERYNAFLLGFKAPQSPKKLQEHELYQKFDHALLSDSPHSYYKSEPFRYALYHLVFKVSPVIIRDYFILKFVSMPEYNLNESW